MCVCLCLCLWVWRPGCNASVINDKYSRLTVKATAEKGHGRPKYSCMSLPFKHPLQPEFSKQARRGAGGENKYDLARKRRRRGRACLSAKELERGRSVEGQRRQDKQDTQTTNKNKPPTTRKEPCGVRVRGKMEQKFRWKSRGELKRELPKASCSKEGEAQ